MIFQDIYEVDFSDRQAHEKTDELFIKRWSPRSYKKAEIPREIIKTIIDAARWSPSAFNEQPWVFITSSTETEFNQFYNLLNDRNKKWAENASILGFIVAKRNHARNDTPNRFYYFDSGAAWMAMTLQARMLGLYTHGMGGILREKIYSSLQIPEETHEVVCGFSIGVLEKPDQLQEEFRLEEKPSPRKSLSEIWMEGSFKQ